MEKSKIEKDYIFWLFVFIYSAISLSDIFLERKN